MKISQHINTWLKNPTDYNLGLKLYNFVKINNKFDKFFLNDGPTQHILLKSQLQTAFTKYVLNPNLDIEINIDIQTLTPSPANVIGKVKPLDHLQNQKPVINGKIKSISNNSQSIKFVDNPYADISKLPADLQDEYAKIKDYYPQLATHQEAMRHATSNDERKLHLNKASKLEKLIRSSWDLINNYVKSNPDLAKTNFTPDSINPKEKLITQVSQDMKALAAAKRNLQRVSKELRENIKMSAKKRDKKLAKQKLFQLEVDRLEKILNQ
jgi:hypothetical protein